MVNNSIETINPTTDLYRDGLRHRIARAIRASGKTNSEVAKACGVQPQAVYGWIKTGRVGKDKLSRLAESTGTTLNWLVSGEDSALEKRPAWKVTSVPLFDWELSGGSGVEVTTIADGIGANAFALIVRGNAMAGEFTDGMTIIVDPDRQPKHGDFVIAEVDGATLLRKLQSDGGRSILAALDPSFSAINLVGDSAIVGVVVEAHKSYG